MRYEIVAPLLLTLSACTSVHIHELPADSAAFAQWQSQQARVAQLSAWTAHASLAVNGPQDNFDARLLWRQHTPHDYQIRLNGPMGQGAVQIQGNAEGVRLRTADGQEKWAATPDELFAEVTSLHLPVRVLTHWLLGVPAPDLPVSQPHWQADGQLAAFHQHDWEVRYSTYALLGEYTVPTRITLEHPDYLVKISVSQWSLATE